MLVPLMMTNGKGCFHYLQVQITLSQSNGGKKQIGEYHYIFSLLCL